MGVLLTTSIATALPFGQAGDPLLFDVDAVAIGIVVGKVLVIFAMLLVATMFMVWFERKLISDMQNRIGPNLAGPFGILQTLADGIKFFFKEDIIPDRAHRRIFILAPYLAFVPAFLLFAVVPFGGDFNNGNDGVVTIFGRETFLQIADPPVGILFLLAMSSLAVYGAMLAGWSSGSKYPLLGSVRASAQMVSYEAALGLSAAAVVLVTGTLSTHEIVVVQAGNGLGGILPNWGALLTLGVPFVIFVIAGTAELNRPPFDLVEAEQELVGGFHTEYSSIRFALFFLAEFMNTITMSAIFVTLFLGGPSGPAPVGPGWAWGVFWFLAKVFIFLFMFVWFRATLPRMRYDQLMDLGWKLLIPLALGWLLFLTALQVADARGWNKGVVVLVSIAVFVAAWGLLRSAVRSGRTLRESGVVD
jgi:NADH-quinone oxidoreductase subunit H